MQGNLACMLCLLLRIYGVLSDAKMLMNHLQHLKHFEKYRHPFRDTEKNWLEARKYIEESFQKFGLLTELQDFGTNIATYDNSLMGVEGANIVGQSVSRDSNAPVILIGTYYDSTVERNPLMESGASVASLLETARGFQDLKRQGSFHQNTTILFVAFDLNTKNYNYNGLPGSHFFAEEWLPEFLNGRKFIGAMLLGSISSFNTEKYSQHLIKGMEKTFPNAYKNINSSEFKGDFLALMSRTDKLNLNFASTFSKNYEKANSVSTFHLENFLLEDGVHIAPGVSNNIRRNPQFDFWTHNPPFPALFLSDMDVHRKDFDFENCKRNCPLERFWSDKRKDFVEATTNSLLHMILEYQTPIPEESDDGDATYPNTAVSLISNKLSVVAVGILLFMRRIPQFI